MVGLRLLAAIILQEDRIIDIEIPSACEQYIDSGYFYITQYDDSDVTFS